MTFVPIKLDDVQESQPVEEGEYDLQIVKAEVGESKKGNTMITVALRVLDEPNASLVNHWIVPPKASDSPERQSLGRLDIARFCYAFGIPYDASQGGFDTEDFHGKTARVFLKKEVNEQDGNEYNRVRLPKLPKDFALE